MSKWIDGKVTAVRCWNSRLKSLIIEAPLESFESGQFVRIGLEQDGEVIARPYSLVNTADDNYLEVYFNIVEEGPLSPLLFELKAGDHIYVGPRPSGFLTISEVPATEHIWLFATGTGIGPFVSILKSTAVWEKYSKVVLCYSVRSPDELAYIDEIKTLTESHADQLIFIPTVTRAEYSGALSARFPQTLQDGTMETLAGVEINPNHSQVMMCGSTDMIRDVSDFLKSRGMK
ncbi:MAG: ferredoxin--NADP+ reductase, partial [Gammaproteobacteria bacterium]